MSLELNKKLWILLEELKENDSEKLLLEEEILLILDKNV